MFRRILHEDERLHTLWMDRGIPHRHDPSPGVSQDMNPFGPYCLPHGLKVSHVFEQSIPHSICASTT